MQKRSVGRFIAASVGVSFIAGADVFMAELFAEEIGANHFSSAGSLVESLTDFGGECFAVFVGIKLSNFDIFNAVSLDLKC